MPAVALKILYFFLIDNLQSDAVRETLNATLVELRDQAAELRAERGEANAALYAEREVSAALRTRVDAVEAETQQQSRRAQVRVLNAWPCQRVVLACVCVCVCICACLRCLLSFY